jgi:hypothetical protein|tara:strand:+ start:100 stop:306 length:207 start_codon:yes stop_codon:yes gene_type:complete
MKVVLYLFMANFGWLEFESYPSFDACKTAEAHILEGNPKIEAMCCSLDKSGCRTEKELAEIIEIDLYK